MMDPSWTSQPPKGTLPCILCKSVISFPNKDKKKYFNHMKKDHGAFYNINLILIINLLERKQVLKLIANIKSGDNNDVIEKKKTVCDAEAQTDEYFQPVDYQPITEDDIILLDSDYPLPQPIMLSNTSNNAMNAQIEDIRRFLGQISEDSNQVVNNEETMDISNYAATADVVNLADQNSFDMEVPSDFELEEAIPMSTPKANKMKKVKKEFIEPNPNLDPIEVMLDGDEDFNILDMTNDDFVLTAGGPQPIKDYTTFLPGAVIPLSYNPYDSISQSCSLDSIDSSQQNIEASPSNASSNPMNTGSAGINKSIQDVLQSENMNVGNIENLIEKKTKKDMLTVYLQNCSEYFKKFPKQISACSKDRALSFTEIDPKLPTGWKTKTLMRKTGQNTGRQDKEFLSPEMKVFRSRIAVVEYMKAMGGYSEEEMFTVLPVKVKREKV
eukprot:GFUD01042109.1.p1 GENE.GFUD01042109.1~~GFUD01042109.1.p1  ORF type:complete len:441 (+),score=100.10 GFUD01042109.1:126-1448(+)